MAQKTKAKSARAEKPPAAHLVDATRWLEACDEAQQGSDEHLQTLYVLTPRLAVAASDRGDFAGARLLTSCFDQHFPPDLTSRARAVVWLLSFSASKPAGQSQSDEKVRVNGPSSKTKKLLKFINSGGSYEAAFANKLTPSVQAARTAVSRAKKSHPNLVSKL